MLKKIFCVLGIIINNVSLGYIINGITEQKVLSNNGEIVLDSSLIYFVAIIPYLIGIGFILYGCFNFKKKRKRGRPRKKVCKNTNKHLTRIKK